MFGCYPYQSVRNVWKLDGLLCILVQRCLYIGSI